MNVIHTSRLHVLTMFAMSLPIYLGSCVGVCSNG